MTQKNASEILRNLIDVLILSLTDLKDVQDTPNEQFAYGEKTAYVECLEIIQQWELAEINGIDFNVEKKFPL